MFKSKKPNAAVGFIAGVILTLSAGAVGMQISNAYYTSGGIEPESSGDHFAPRRLGEYEVWKEVQELEGYDRVENPARYQAGAGIDTSVVDDHFSPRSWEEYEEWKKENPEASARTKEDVAAAKRRFTNNLRASVLPMERLTLDEAVEYCDGLSGKRLADCMGNYFKTGYKYDAFTPNQ